MKTKAILLCLLLPPGLPVPAAAQLREAADSALVRISGLREGTPVRGSGFVVAVEGDKATIVTASHVIEGVEKLEVSFAADKWKTLYDSLTVLGMEPQDPNGLAVFQVRGIRDRPLPKDLTWLFLDDDRRPGKGAALTLVGFPEREPNPVHSQGVLARRSGALLVIDRAVGEGSSGGPVFEGYKVVGIVTTVEEEETWAVSAVVARETLLGWEVKLGGAACVQGEERKDDDSGLVFVRLCGGTFLLGSPDGDPDEKPVHAVTLSDFWMGKHEVTNEQYKSFRKDHQGAARLPAVNVSWDLARAACEHWGGRLPTEAEWEYAARAGTQTRWSFGKDKKKLREYAWYGEKERTEPHAVGTKRPNAWGLHDLYGNAWEWVADGYGPYPAEPQKDPQGPPTGDHILRGGSFANTDENNVRSANRHPFTTGGELIKGIGFRCVRDSAPRVAP